MNYRQAKIVLRTLIFLIVLAVALALYFRFRPAGASHPTPTPAPTSVSQEVKDAAKSTINHLKSTVSKPLKISSKVQNHSKQFNDLNEDHLVYASKNGIKPINASRDIMAMSRPIVKIKSCDDFHVSDLTHSYPYLVEPAALLLHDIGMEFNRKLEAQGGGKYKINVTSLLRTSESVGRLKRGNVNSTENSAHLYGTTFDLSYVNFYEGHMNTRKHSDGDLKNLLAEVLLEMKEKGRCLVKYERKQGCFHITATGK